MRHHNQWWLVIAGAVLLLALTTAPVYAAATPPPAPSLAQQDDVIWRCVVVNGPMALNIRSGPSLDYDVVATQAAGDRLEADYSRQQNANSYTWVPVRFTDATGWAVKHRLDTCQDQLSGVVDDDGLLDRYEIAELARTVVLLANVTNSGMASTGTGTITSPDGVIVTNAHVVEDADFLAVAILDDINDPPEYRYMAEVITTDLVYDVAMVAIRYDMDGNPVQTSALNLPYIPTLVAASEVYRGDTVYIFGYPGIGDDYLVVTSGSIVSVENGNVGTQRLPVWYRTDAEIAPGNSGGLVVNGNGQFIGIPTTVRAEGQTGGRLGGIRPAEVALMAVGGDTPVVTAPPATPAPDSAVWVELDNLWLEHNVVEDGLPGIRMHAAFVIGGWAQRAATLYARFYLDETGAPIVNASAPSPYRDADDAVIAQAPLLPCCAQTIYDNLVLFVPYQALGIAQPGSYPINIQFEVASDDQSWQRELGWQYITYARQ
jgi:S1-C subfamily serine protease